MWFGGPALGFLGKTQYNSVIFNWQANFNMASM
jgi:hypothetical protein